MIEDIAFSFESRTYLIGQDSPSPSIVLRKPTPAMIEVVGTSQRNAVAIECFVRNPPPPQLKTCGACGTFELPSRVWHSFVLTPEMFSGGTGSLNLSAQDEESSFHGSIDVTIEAEAEAAYAVSV
jgi:hypothetical protein